MYLQVVVGDHKVVKTHAPLSRPLEFATILSTKPNALDNSDITRDLKTLEKLFPFSTLSPGSFHFLHRPF